MRSPEDWGDVYAERESTYARFAERLEELLRNLLQDAELGYVSSQSSSMDVEEFVGEIYVNEREGTAVVDPFAVFGDIARVRIVTGTRSESEQVCALVEREFEVDAELSMSFATAEAGNADMVRAGYPGRVAYDCPHLVVTQTDERLALPEWSEFGGLRAEIAVPTLLQDRWIEIDDHVLSYIWDTSYPEAVRDAIVRAARHLADADVQLSEVTEATARMEDEYERAIAQGELDLELNVSSLYVYLRDSELVGRLAATAEEAGMSDEPEQVWVHEDDLWIVRACGFDRVADVDRFLLDAEPRSSDVLKRLFELTREDDGFVLQAVREHVVAWLLLVLTRADAELVALARFRPSIEKALNTLIGNRVER